MVNAHYHLIIDQAFKHVLKVRLQLSVPEKLPNKLKFFLPVWSPGSYLIREYSKNLLRIQFIAQNGQLLPHEQIDKNTWQIDASDLDQEITIEYELYLHEISVRTSFIDNSHAFLHGPSIYLGSEDLAINQYSVELSFPSHWQKVSTGLKDISQDRKKFIYSAKDYDELVDTPIEIGNQETDGFLLEDKAHHLVFYGKQVPHSFDFKSDISKVVAHVRSYFSGELPYDHYSFITHFIPGHYGGLEHHNSTALQFDSTVIAQKKEYQNFLSLVAHEYFHTWNVKRIRPLALGPFDYNRENYTKMHWLTEGLTSFMDDLIIFRCGLSSISEYLELLKKKINFYQAQPGRHYQSLEESSFNTWIKLYRPDENSRNCSISYYLKGSLVFLCAHIFMRQHKSSINSFISDLWSEYKKRPEQGLIKEEVLKLLANHMSDADLEKFKTMLVTCEDIDFTSILKMAGIELFYAKDDAREKLSFGYDLKSSSSEKLIVERVYRDGAAYKGGLNAGDEILAINQIRVSKTSLANIEKELIENTNYNFLISRQGVIEQVQLTPSKAMPEIAELKIIDEELCLATFK